VDDKRLSADQWELLAKSLPTPQEVEKVKAHKGADDTMQFAALFFRY
jgi:hypothetical protein